MLGIAKPIDDNSEEFSITSLIDVFEAQERINKKKRNLQRRDDQTAADWLSLAWEYGQIDSRANYAYCITKAEALTAAALDPQTDEEKEEWWQK